MSRYLFVIGTLPFIVLGVLHILLTPKRLRPYDDSVRLAMERSTLALTKQTTMWRAWVGFNMSHGLGLLLFGSIYLWLALTEFAFLSTSLFLQLTAVIVSATYFFLAIKYWFPIPAIASALGCASFLIAMILRK